MKLNEKINQNLTGVNLQNKSIDISEIEGAFVLFFYPKDDTPGCTIESQEFTQLSSEFEKSGVKVFGISRDSHSSHCKFRDKFDLQVDLISDPDGLICKYFDVLTEKSMFGKKYIGINRTTFFIKNKEVLKIWNNVSPKGHAKEVLEFCKAK